MSKTIDKITREVLTLPRSSRARLANKLLASLETNSRPLIEEAWLKAITRRVKEVKSGKVKLIAGGAALRYARTRLK